MPCNSLCNTPILGVKKPNAGCRLVQYLCLVNEVVVPIHPIVPNPYTLLTQIPENAKWFTVLDLKDAFFCTPLHPHFQYFFAFEDPTNQATQIMWTVLFQGFRDSPHLFDQALSRNLPDFLFPQTQVLQYVDDLLLCSSLEEDCQEE